jgi:hypothetical protein
MKAVKSAERVAAGSSFKPLFTQNEERGATTMPKTTCGLPPEAAARWTLIWNDEMAGWARFAP